LSWCNKKIFFRVPAMSPQNKIRAHYQTHAGMT